jgi:ABC-2 type transport system ATP-binding protein
VVAKASGGAVLIAERLSKSYEKGGGRALGELSFELQRGHVMGFLGPNGAGKTTSIRILTTIMQPTTGRFSIDGISSERPANIRPRIGVLPETLGLPNQITGTEYLSYFAQLYGRKRSDARRHALGLLELVGLRARAGRLIRTYSHGMRQRLGLARALVNDPVVLFLDEPVVGLDPKGQQDLLELLRTIAVDRGAGIIFCSHSLGDVEGVCDDVVILSSGHVVASGSISEVIARSRRDAAPRTAVLLRLPKSAIDRAMTTLRSLDAIDDVAVVDGQLRVSVERSDRADAADRAATEMARHLIDADIPVLGFEIEGTRLTDVFMELTAGDIS